MEYINKENNFLSVVVVCENNADIIEKRINNLGDCLNENFKDYEIIVVDNYSNDNSISKLKSLNHKITIIELSRKHGMQAAQKAGVDIAIGDFVV